MSIFIIAFPEFCPITRLITRIIYITFFIGPLIGVAMDFWPVYIF